MLSNPNNGTLLWDLIIQKGTELGVQKFIPVLSERTNVKEINIRRIKKIIVDFFNF